MTDLTKWLYVNGTAMSAKTFVVGNERHRVFGFPLTMTLYSELIKEMMKDEKFIIDAEVIPLMSTTSIPLVEGKLPETFTSTWNSLNGFPTYLDTKTTAPEQLYQALIYMNALGMDPNLSYVTSIVAYLYKTLKEEGKRLHELAPLIDGVIPMFVAFNRQDPYLYGLAYELALQLPYKYRRQLLFNDEMAHTIHIIGEKKSYECKEVIPDDHGIFTLQQICEAKKVKLVLLSRGIYQTHSGQDLHSYRFNGTNTFDVVEVNSTTSYVSGKGQTSKTSIALTAMDEESGTIKDFTITNHHNGTGAIWTLSTGKSAMLRLGSLHAIPSSQ